MASSITIGDMFYQGGVFEGCINLDDLGVSRRPYHRNCNCPLHKMCEHSSRTSTISNVSYPIKRIGSQGSLAMMVSRNDSSSSYSTRATRPINKVTCDHERPLFDFGGDN